MKLRLKQLIDEYAQQQGTNFECAFRDALTDMMALAQENLLDFNERVSVAMLVHDEEQPGW